MKIFRCQRKDGIRVRLCTKFMIGIIILECLLMFATILVVEHRMRESILDEFLKRGLSVAKNLAAMNTNYVATYNYVNIEQSVAKITEDNGLMYAAVLLFDGEVAAYSGRLDIQQKVLQGDIHKQALRSDKAMVQYGTLTGPEDEVCDIAAPIIIKGEKWATVRVGFSLEDMHEALLKTRRALFALGFVALISGCLGSVLLARRITRPVGVLVNSVEAISDGDYAREISISTNDEIGYLGKRFTAMQETLKNHIQLLTDTNLELTHSNMRLQSLFQVSQAMNSLQNQEKLYDFILEAALTATGAFGGSLTLVDQNQKAQTVATAIKNNADDDATRLIGKNLLDEQTYQNQSFLVGPSIRPLLLQLENFREDMPFFKMRIDSNPDLELLSIPLQQSGTLMGFINLIKKRNNGKVDASEMQTLSVLSSHATSSLENRKLFVELENAYLSSIKSLAKTLELKDEYTHGHAERLARICMKIGQRMNMDEKLQKVIHNAALLHDIGKIGIMESILNKNSILDTEEWDKIRRHPVFGEEILRPIFSLQEECKIVRHHHEREDGCGYPDGLYGNRLTLPEKIIIVADAYDAMNSKRAYRSPLNPADIRHELQKNKGSQFDAEVVDVFLKILEEEPTDLLSPARASKVIHFYMNKSGNNLREKM